MEKRVEYLRRVGLTAMPAATEEGLRELHAAQAFAIPFENFSVLLGEPVRLDPDSLFAKLVARRRGGYCFELNALFEWALREAGFVPATKLARVQMGRPEPGPLTHQLCLVEVGPRTWLADVGFGGPGIRYPMPFELGRVDMQDGEEFRLGRDPDFGYALERKGESGEWLRTYLFQSAPVLPIDIEMGSYFTSTWPSSVFRKGLMLARPVPGGKHTLYGMELKRWELGATTGVETLRAAGLPAVLRERFGIELDAEKISRLSAILEPVK